MTLTAAPPIVGLKLQDPLAAKVIAEALKMDGHPSSVLGPEILPSDHCRVMIMDEAGPGSFLDICRERGVLVIQTAGKIRLGEMLADVRRGLDNRGRALSGTLIFASYQLNLSQMVLTYMPDGRKVTLTEKEQDILSRLHKAQGQTVDRKTLLEDVWGYGSAIETHTLETHIYRLRKKLETDPASPNILITEENGYRLAMH